MKNLLLFILLLLSVSLLNAYTIVSFDPSVVYQGNSSSELAQHDASVGITEFTIEDFEDKNNMLPGLSITFSGPNDHGNPTSSAWDGVNFWDLNVYEGDITFTYTPGAKSLGIGIGDVESNVEIFVNNESLGLITDLDNYNRIQDGYREVYIRVDMEAGDSFINTIRFTQISGSGDALILDRLALDLRGIPEPSTLFLFLASILICMRIKKKLGRLSP